MKVNFDDLELALEFTSFDSMVGENEAYLCTKTGTIYYDYDGTDDELPEDLYENDQYIQYSVQKALTLDSKHCWLTETDWIVGMNMNKRHKKLS